MRKEKFKIGDTVKCPEGIYKISYFLTVTSVKDSQGKFRLIKEDYFEKGFQIMIKGVGLYNENDIELIENKESLTLSNVITKLENLQRYYIDSSSGSGPFTGLAVEENQELGEWIKLEDIENLLKELK